MFEISCALGRSYLQQALTRLGAPSAQTMASPGPWRSFLNRSVDVALKGTSRGTYMTLSSRSYKNVADEYALD